MSAKTPHSLEHLLALNKTRQSEAFVCYGKAEYMPAAELMFAILNDLEPEVFAIENSFPPEKDSQEFLMAAQLAKAYNGIQVVYMHTGDFARAIEYLNKGIQLTEKIGELHTLSGLYCNLGHLYQQMGDYRKAEEQYLNALHVIGKTEKPNLDFEMNTLSGLGGIKKQAKDYSAALAYHFRSLAISENLPVGPRLFFELCHIAEVYMLNHEFENTLSFLDRASALQFEGNTVMHQAALQWNYGCLYAQAAFNGKDLDKALYFLSKAYELNQEAGEQTDMDLLNSLIDVHKQKGNYQDALLYTDEVLARREQQAGAEVNRRAQWMEFNVRAETLKKEHREREIRASEQEKILHKILPAQIAERIAQGEGKIIQRYEIASVLFADMVGFTVWSQTKTVDEVADTLNTLFNLFDELANEFGVEKIKTIGDAYMCVAGVPEVCEDHAERMAKMALAMLSKVESNFPNGEIKLRIGIHSGEVIAGVLGKNKYAYDLWGDTVNTASRMESHGAADKIQVSEEFRNAMKDSTFHFEERGEMEVKGKGKLKTFFLNRTV